MSACELSARVTPGDSKCEAYRSSGSVTCRYCEIGPSIKTVRDDMAGSVCKHEGCEKSRFIGGYCASHASLHGLGMELQARYDKARARAVAKSVPPSPDTKPKTAAAAKVQVKDVVAPVAERPAPSVVMSEMDMELDQLFKAKRAAWLYDLANATTIRSRAKMFLSMSDSLEGLVY